MLSTESLSSSQGPTSWAAHHHGLSLGDRPLGTMLFHLAAWYEDRVLPEAGGGQWEVCRDSLGRPLAGQQPQDWAVLHPQLPAATYSQPHADPVKWGKALPVLCWHCTSSSPRSGAVMHYDILILQTTDAHTII